MTKTNRKFEDSVLQSEKDDILKMDAGDVRGRDLECENVKTLFSSNVENVVKSKG